MLVSWSGTVSYQVRDREIAGGALEAIKRLEINPFGPPPGIKKLKGKGIGQWRLEVWPYRVRYDVIGQKVALYRVRHRREIYRD